MLNQKMDFIARHVWHVDSCLSLNQHGMSKISSSIQISTKIGKTTMRTSKTSRQTRTKPTTLVAQLARHMRVDAQNSNASTLSLVLNKVLQLEKTPIAYPIIHSPATICSPYSLEVFHNDFVSVKIGNNSFADAMVRISHKPFFSSTNFSQQSLGGTSAFRLQSGTQKLELSLNGLNLRGMEELAVTGDGQVFDSEVNANNVLRTNAGIDLFGKHEQEKHSTLIIHSEQAFTHLPVRTEILLVTNRDIEGNPYSALHACNAQHAIFETGTSRKIVFNACIPDDGFGFGNLNHSTSLFDTSNAELGLQAQTAQMFVYEWLQFECILNALFPSNVNAVLQAGTIGFDCLYEFRTSNNLDFCSSTCSHDEYKVRGVYKLDGGDEWQFLPQLKQWASLPHES